MKRSLKRWAFLALLLLSAHSLIPLSRAQETEKLPSQKTKEAIGKFKKAPAAVGKLLEEMKEAGKSKLKETFGGTKMSAEAKTDSSSLSEKKPEQPERPRYSGVGKRDPFQPFRVRIAVTKRKRKNLSPLERYELGQLKLVAIVWHIKEPRAMVEDSAGLGYILKVGTPIGTSEGKVKAIKPTEVVIEESVTDFYGARKNREVSLKLPKEK